MKPPRQGPRLRFCEGKARRQHMCNLRSPLIHFLRATTEDNAKQPRARATEVESRAEHTTIVHVQRLSFLHIHKIHTRVLILRQHMWRVVGHDGRAAPSIAAYCLSTISTVNLWNVMACMCQKPDGFPPSNSKTLVFGNVARSHWTRRCPPSRPGRRR